MVTKKKLFLAVTSLLFSVNLCAASNDELFPANLPPVQFTEFQAAGFKTPVSGVIYDLTHPPVAA